MSKYPSLVFNAKNDEAITTTRYKANKMKTGFLKMEKSVKLFFLAKKTVALKSVRKMDTANKRGINIASSAELRCINGRIRIKKPEKM